MTGYSAYSSLPANASISLQPVNYQIRLVKFEFFSSYYPAYVSLTVYSGATVSGGTVTTPLPFRAGASPATTVAKIAPTVSGGTNATIHFDYAAAYSAGSYQLPFDLIIAPGSVILLSLTNSGTYSVTGSIYFEELHLARSN